MGFNSTATTLTLTAKLTPIGRQKIVSNNNNLIKTFSLGDSDANYYSPLTLATGTIPSLGGNIGPNSTVSNSTARKVSINSLLIVNSNGSLSKPVSSQSINVVTEVNPVGYTTVSGSGLTQMIIDRNDLSTDSLVNLFYSFGLPLNTSEDNDYTGKTYAQGGYSNTALSGLSVDKILVLAIDKASYGDTIDGKTLSVSVTTTASTFTIYSTYQGGLNTLPVLDTLYSDNSSELTKYGNNVSVLVSDDIMKPNGGDAALSWSTGYNLEKPFSVRNKKPYNLQTNSNLGLTADTVVGLAFLDKGFIVITEPTIVDNYISSTATTVSFNSVSTDVFQTITCIADRGEFGSTTNRTFEAGDIPRISEVGLFDDLGNLIAVAKSDRHISKNVNEFLALSIKITL
jgi:hypothetical protein